MGGALIVLVAALAVATVLRARLRVVFGVLVATLLLVPDAIVVPNGFTSVLTLPRVVVVAVLVRLLIDVRERRIPAGALRATRVHVLLGVFLAVAGVDGVVLAAPTTSASAAAHGWLDLVDMAIVFAVVVALLRVIGDLRFAMNVLAAGVAVFAAIGVVEHVVGASYAHAWYSLVPKQATGLPVQTLEQRGGDVRVRASAGFALSYAWTLAMLLPTLVVVVARWGRERLLVGLGALAIGGLALYWTYSRSALPVVGLGLALVALATGHRRVAAVAGGAATAAVVAVLVVPRLLHGYRLSTDTGSVDIRTQRLPGILHVGAGSPFHGVGLSGLRSFGFAATDSSYLLVYVTLGVLGVVSLLLALAAAIATSAEALTTAQGEVREAAAVALTGTATLALGALAFDAFTVLGSGRLFWLLTALGVVAAERAGALRGLHPLTSARLLTVGVAALAGGCFFAITPSHVAVGYLFETLPIQREAAHYDPVIAGGKLIGTACGVIRADVSRLHDVKVTCEDMHAAAGVGSLRVQASNQAEVEAAVTAATDAARGVAHIFGFRLHQTYLASGRMTVAETAPVSAPLLALGVVLLMPESRRRSRLPAYPTRSALQPSSAALG